MTAERAPSTASSTTSSRPARGPTSARKGRHRLAVKVAPFWRRLLADLIDLAALAGIVWGLWTAGVIAPAGGLPVQEFDWIDYTAELLAEHLHLFDRAAVATLAIGAIYGVLTRAIMSGTVGERMLGLRLIGPDGEGAGPLRVLAHVLGTLIGLGLLTLGYVWAAVDPKRQGLAGHLSGTLLIVGRPDQE